MSVATEFSHFSQFSSTAFAPVPARHPARPEAPVSRSRLRLVPPVDGCVPGSRRVGGARRGAVRVGGRVRLAPACAEPVRAFQAEGVGAAQLQARPLRLTRRGMVASAVGLALVGGLLLLVAYLSAGSPASQPTAVPGSVITVQPGDTLWSIAGQVAPGHDPRRVVERLREVNQLSSVSLTPGQTLKVG